jgi:hypothetical protein
MRYVAIGGKSTRKGGFDDATSEETSRIVRRIRSDHRIAAKSANGTPGEGLAGHISEARPLTSPVVYKSSIGSPAVVVFVAPAI